MAKNKIDWNTYLLARDTKNTTNIGGRIHNELLTAIDKVIPKQHQKSGASRIEYLIIRHLEQMGK